MMEEYLRLGILNAQELVLDIKKGSCAFPTSACARPRAHNGPAVEKENLDFGFWWAVGDLNKPIEQKGRQWFLRDKQDLKLEIKIGDVEVDAWFKAHPRHQKTYEEFCDALGRIAVETPENIARRKQVLETLAKLTKEKAGIIYGLKNSLSFIAYTSDEHNIWLPKEHCPWNTELKNSVENIKNIDIQIAQEVNEALKIGLGHIASIRNLAKQYEVKK